MKITILLLAIIFSFAANAQIKSSPFRSIPKPAMKASLYGVTVNSTITAWRFTPMAGYNITTKQVMAGIAYGIQWLHVDPTTQRYYTDFSIQAVGWVNGSTPPTLAPPNFASFGVTLGLLNQLIQIGGAYTPATALTKSQIGLVVNLGITFNN